MEVLARALTRLHHQHPLIRCHIYSANANDVTERLERGLLDFGLMIEPVSKGKYDHLSLPQYNVMGLLTRKDSGLAQKERITPQDLLGVPLLTSSRQYEDRQPEFAAWMGENYERLEVVGTFNLLYNAALLVESGLGHAVCIDGLADTSAESPLCFRPIFPELRSHLVLVWKKYQPLSKAERLFLEEVRAELG
jgi:DNA-binding transcriptional LysR family regulator